MSSPPPALQNFISLAHKVFKGIWSRPAAAAAATLSSSSLSSLSERNLNELSQLTKEMDRLDASNMGIHTLGKNLTNPVTFVDAVKPNPILHAVIIFIKPGHIIPLHDHPGMFGLIKVLNGQVRVRSYSLITPKDKAEQENSTTNGKTGESQSVYQAVRYPDVILNSSSSPAVISPEVRNIHEIECIGGEGEHNYAAFLDVLSPPYNDELEDDACHYFESNEKDRMKPFEGEEEPRQVHLIQTRCPKTYVTASHSLG